MKDYLKRRMKVRTNGLRNCLWSIFFNDQWSIHHRIVVRDIYGQDHEIYNEERAITHIPSERHVYHVRYHVKVPSPILFIRLERIDHETGEWMPISCIDFMRTYSCNEFVPGWYMLYDSFRWNDVFEDK